MATFGLADEGRAGLTTDLEATGNGSVIAILKRIRTLLSGTGSMRITDGTSTATVRDLPTNDALNVAIVDANGDQITSFGGGTQYTEDAAAPADPVGNTLMFTRDDQLAAITEVEGDWSRVRGTSKGALWVALADSAGDPITSFGGGTQYTEDVVAAADPTGNALLVTRDDQLSAVTEAEGDWSRLRGTAKGALWVGQDPAPAALTYTAVGVASSGNNTIVTNSNAGLKIRVYGAFLMSGSANNIYFTSDAGGTVIIGNATNKIQLAANQGFVLPQSLWGWAETATNQDVVLNLSGATAVAGVIVTAEV